MQKNCHLTEEFSSASTEMFTSCPLTLSTFWMLTALIIHSLPKKKKKKVRQKRSGKGGAADSFTLLGNEEGC